MPAASPPAAKVPQKAAEVCARYEPSKPVNDLLRLDHTPEAFVALLRERNLDDEALEFRTRQLPTREGVWWVSQCLWHLFRPEPPAKTAAALKAAVRWVQEPNEDHRRAAETAGRDHDDTPAGCLALAVFFSGGSIAPKGLPEVPAPPDLSATMLHASLLLAVTQADPARKPELLRLFHQLAAEVASGKNQWQ